MDLFTFIVAIMMMALSWNYGQGWIVFLILLLLVVTNKEWPMTILLIVSVAAIFIMQGTEIGIYWPLVLVGLIVVAILLGKRPAEESPEFFAPEGGGDMGGYGGLLGGM